MAKKIKYADLFTLRKDGRYMYRYTDETGRHCIYDRDPEKLWQKIQAAQEPEKVTFSKLADTWQRQHWEQVGYKTAEAYTAPLRRIRDRFGNCKPEEVTAQTIYAFLCSLGRQGYSRRSVQMHRDILNMIFNAAIMDGNLTSNPCVAVSMPRNLTTTKRTLPTDEAVQSVRNSGNAPFGLFAQICLYAGLRRGEALALTHEDIDRENRCIHITKAVEFVGNNPHIKTPKTAAGTRDAVLLDVLAEQIPEGTGLIFCREDGGLLTKTQYRKRWQKYCEAIGCEITAHQLRHGFATILYEAGIPDKDAQELLGHSSITITRDVYTHIRQSRRNDTASKLNAFVSAPTNSDTNFDTK